MMPWLKFMFMNSSGSFFKQFAWTLSLLLRYEVHPEVSSQWKGSWLSPFQTKFIHTQVILPVHVPALLRIINSFLSLLMVCTFFMCMYAHGCMFIQCHICIYICMHACIYRAESHSFLAKKPLTLANSKHIWFPALSLAFPVIAPF